MHFFKGTAALLGLILLCGGWAFAAEKDAMAELKETARAIGEYSAEQKDAAVAKAREMMEKLDVRLERWEEDVEDRMGGLQQGARERARESKKQLRRQRNELSEWYGRMKDSSKETWRDVKEGFASAYDAVVQSWERADRQVDGEK